MKRRFIRRQSPSLSSLKACTPFPSGSTLRLYPESPNKLFRLPLPYSWPRSWFSRQTSFAIQFLNRIPVGTSSPSAEFSHPRWTSFRIKGVGGFQNLRMNSFLPLNLPPPSSHIGASLVPQCLSTFASGSFPAVVTSCFLVKYSPVFGTSVSPLPLQELLVSLLPDKL